MSRNSRPQEMEMENGLNSSKTAIIGPAQSGYFISQTKAIVFVVVAVAAVIIVGVTVWAVNPEPELVKQVVETKAPPTKTTPTAPTAAPTTKEPIDVRLPTDLEAVSYRISLRPFLEDSDGDKQFKFDGTVSVELRVKKATSEVILHINDLNIDKKTIKLKDEDNKEVAVKDWIHDEERQFFKLPTETELKSGSTYTLEMSYEGNLNDKLAGFYRSKYTRKDGTVQFLATTQFQPTDARRAFPCMDEPAMKSVFYITIKCDKKYTAISNSELDGAATDIAGGLKEFKFKPTLKMSTYLVAFVVSDFKSKEKKVDGTGTLVRVWSRPDAIETATYALDAGVKILKHFEDFFKQKFPLSKQDMVAVPDFNAGAMENWGLITYRETAMLYDPKKSSLANKQRVCLVVSHELAHQWFGNLVTPKWWNDLWLNEGFASFVENIGIDVVEPKWHIMEQFVTGELQPVMEEDSLSTSHPISQEVSNPDQINELFDSISYSKGAALIRMMDFFLSRETLQNGLQKYLEEFKYQNTDSADLWEKLTEAANNAINVSVVMETWTTQMGYPVVTVKKKDDTAELRQERFLLEGKASSTLASPSYRWHIPFTYTTEDKMQWNSTESKIEWMSPENDVVTLKGLNKDSWIIGNVEQMGYYRVNYDLETWKKIQNQLETNYNLIEVKNRAQLISDAFNLARANLLSYDVAFDTAEFLKGDAAFIPWAAAYDSLSFVRQMLATTSVLGDYQKYIRGIAEKQYKRLGFTGTDTDSALDIYLRSRVISLMCGAGSVECLEEAAKQLKLWVDNPATNPVPTNLRAQIYCYGIASGPSEYFNFIFKKYEEEEVAAEKKRLLRSLACSKEPWILNRLLEEAIAGKAIRNQDTTSVIQYVSMNDIGAYLAWDFIRDKWSVLLERFGGGSFSFSNLINTVTSGFSTEARLAELNEFMAKNEDRGSASRAFDQAVEKTKSNIDWMKNNFDSVKKWLEDNAAKS